MTISGLTPTTALPTLATGASLAGSNPLLAAPGTSLAASSNPLLGAPLGVAEKPGIATRFMNAMKAAVGELRGVPQQPQQPAISLPMVSPAPVDSPKPATAPKRAVKAKTFTDKQGNVRQVGTGTIVKPAAGATAAPAAAPTTVAPQQQLPANAVQIPGATVYGFDQNGNPVAPTMQSLGMTPTMLQGLEGMAGAVDPDGPQVNATNQTNLSGLGTGGFGVGSAVPVLGAPIATTPAVTSPGDTPAGTGTGTGGNQTVHNRNENDQLNRNQGIGYGGWGGIGGTPWNGIATPSAPYGASMTGAYLLGDSTRRFF